MKKRSSGYEVTRGSIDCSTPGVAATNYFQTLRLKKLANLYKISIDDMQAGVIPVLVAGDGVVTTATNAIKALFEQDVISNGSYSIELDHCVTIEKKCGVFLDEELLKVCDKKEDAEASLQKVQKAIEVIENMEFGQPLSFLKLFDHVPMSFGLDDEDIEELKHNRVDL